MPVAQNPHAVIMIRPRAFGANPETAADNHFQGADRPGAAAAATAEMDQAIAQLRAAGVTVHDFAETTKDTPDAVFPNNWLSTHADGTIVLYPMRMPSRRRERRADIVDALRRQYAVARVIDLSPAEQVGEALEGTGAVIYDHAARRAFMARSPRASAAVLADVTAALGFEPVIFDAVDVAGRAIYHTNVMLNLGQHLGLICSRTIADPAQRSRLLDRIAAPGRQVIDLDPSQMAEFAVNAMEVDTASGSVLVMSARGAAALTNHQRADIEARLPLVILDLPVIETGGGSARCLMAGVHLQMR